MRLLPKLRVIGSVVLAGALAACGSSALYGVPGAESPGSSSPAKREQVSRLSIPRAESSLASRHPAHRTRSGRCRRSPPAPAPIRT